MSKLEKFLKATLTAEAYEALPDTLKITKTRTTQLLNNPPIMSADEILKLFLILENVGYNEGIVGLVNDYHCGFDRLTISDVERLVCHDVHIELLY